MRNVSCTVAVLNEIDAVISLEDRRRLGSLSIIIRMSAIRKLAAEAADKALDQLGSR
jgi:hypothetical protein